jgi:hypothetical protein
MLLLQAFVGWLNVFVALAGVLLCAAFFFRSRFMTVLILGFGLEAIVDVFYRVSSLTIGLGGYSSRRMGAVYFVAALIGLLARVVILGGLVGVFSDLPRRAGDAAPPKP